MTDSLRRSYFIFYSGKGWKHFFKLPKGKKWESSENVIFKGVITRGSEDFTILPNDKHGYTKLIEYLGSNSFPEPDEMLSRILDHPETDYNTLSLGITTANIATLLRNPAPEIKFLFKDMIPAGTLGGLVGQGGIGKSYIVMELIVSAAIGRKLIAAFDPVEPCEVLYVQAEDQLDELHRRLRKIFDYYNLTEAEIALCEKNIQLCLFQAKSLVMSIKGKELETTESFEWLENRIKQQDTKFCVLDPLSSFSWIEENSNSEVAQYMAKLRTLTKLTDEGTTILCVHHTSKANQESMDSSSGRGASAFRDAFRFNLTMTSASSKAQEYGIQGDIHNYALIGVTKANMSARNNTDILLKRASGKNGGVISEISISELKGTLKKARLDRLAKLLPELIASNPNDFSINQWKTGSTEEIKDFKSILKDEHKATQKNIPEAFDRAIELELIRIDEIPVDGSKRPKQVPRAIESDPTK